jgi:hypothetical protein
MRSIKPFVYEQNWYSAGKVIKKADEILHSKGEEIGVTEQEAFDAIKGTIAIAELLFAAGKQSKRS